MEHVEIVIKKRLEPATDLALVSFSSFLGRELVSIVKFPYFAIGFPKADTFDKNGLSAFRFLSISL
jgi:hypothetical protein